MFSTAPYHLYFLSDDCKFAAWQHPDQVIQIVDEHYSGKWPNPKVTKVITFDFLGHLITGAT